MTSGDALFRRLVDDAGVFPPAQLPMPAALAAHRAALAGPYALVLGRFLAPASRLAEYAFAAGAARPELGVIVDVLSDETSPADVRSAGNLVSGYTPTSVEVVARGAGALAERARVLVEGFAGRSGSADLFVELPRGGAFTEWPVAIETLGELRSAGHAVGAKVRCAAAGDTDAPTEQELARFVIACRDAGTPFKATAGLHHAMRHTREDGYERHGFLNLLLGAAVSLRAGSVDDVAGVLAEREAAVVVKGVLELADDEVLRVRNELFIAFGCCDPLEPIADLLDLHLLERD